MSFNYWLIKIDFMSNMSAHTLNEPMKIKHEVDLIYFYDRIKHIINVHFKRIQAMDVIH